MIIITLRTQECQSKRIQIHKTKAKAKEKPIANRFLARISSSLMIVMTERDGEEQDLY